MWGFWNWLSVDWPINLHFFHYTSLNWSHAIDFGSCRPKLYRSWSANESSFPLVPNPQIQSNAQKAIFRWHFPKRIQIQTPISSTMIMNTPLFGFFVVVDRQTEINWASICEMSSNLTCHYLPRALVHQMSMSNGQCPMRYFIHFISYLHSIPRIWSALTHSSHTRPHVSFSSSWLSPHSAKQGKASGNKGHMTSFF